MLFVALALATWASAAPPPQAAAAPCGACVTLTVSPGQARLILQARPSLAGLDVLLLPGAAPPEEWAGLLEQMAAAGATVGIVVEAGTDVATRLPKVARTVLLDARQAPVDVETAFELKSSAAAFRGAGVQRLGLRLNPAQRPDAEAHGLAPYFDVLVVPGPPPAPAPGDPFGAVERWTVLPSGGRLDPMTALRATAHHTAARVLVALPPGDEPLVPVLAALAALVPSGLVPLPDVSVDCDSACEAEAYLEASTLDAVVLVRPRSPVSVLTVRPAAAAITAIVPSRALHVPLPGQGPPWRWAAKGGRLSLPREAGPIVLRAQGWKGGAEEAFATGVEVRGQRTFTVEEVVARHQAWRARQAAAVRALVSAGRTVLTFDAPGFSAPVTVTAATTIYTSADATEVAQRDIRVNGLLLATKGDEVPKLPLIEPERVSTPPLVIALTDAYRYRLEGLENWRGRPTYVVAFEPTTDDRSLFAGRAWIDGETFGLARLDATQTALPGPVVMSRQVDDFVMVTQAGEALWLPSRSEINQRYETASYATPIRRVVTLTEHAVNPPDFAARLEAAHGSDAVMLRETPEGFRYLRRERAAGASGESTTTRAGTPKTAPPPGPRRRLVDQSRADRVRTIAGGITWDPNITVPLVFGGLSYLDFNLFGTGAQLDGFFGGTYGRLAWSGPPIGRSGWRASGDAFGIAFSYNERMFRNGVEQYGENVTQRPFHVAAGLVGPLIGAWRLRASYEMDYTSYGRSDSTSPRFVAPVSTPVHGLRLTLERQRGPWVFGAWWNVAARQRWMAWGLPERREPVIGTFQRHGLRASRSFVWSPRAVGRVEAAWMDGHRLDRFSRYGFGTFDNPLRGYPSASVRYSRGVAVRSSASWTVASRLRLDGFADLGIVRDPGRSRRAEAFPGIGAGAQVPVPLGMLGALEWGYGFEGINSDGRKGTQVVRLMIYKVF